MKRLVMISFIILTSCILPSSCAPPLTAGQIQSPMLPQSTPESELPAVEGCDITDLIAEESSSYSADVDSAYDSIVEILLQWDVASILNQENLVVLCFHDEASDSYHFEISTVVDSIYGPPGAILREASDGSVLAIPSEGSMLDWHREAATLVQIDELGDLSAFWGIDLAWHDATEFDETLRTFLYHHAETSITYAFNAESTEWEITPDGSAIPPSLRTGFRYSTYGPDYDPGPAYWAYVGQQMADRFPDATPQAVWIVAEHHTDGRTTRLGFPGNGEILFTTFSEVDGNEEALALFDDLGIEVWLQVEPMSAPVDELIRIVLDRYDHHPCIIGVGIDVEWYDIANYPDGRPVTDEEALSWLSLVHSYDADYRIFLKHWLVNRMPPTARDGIVFVNDAQRHPSFEAMLGLFAEWGETFAPAPVAFQYGYEGDRQWWDDFADPPGDVGAAILAAVPNTEALYWVDFSVLSVFPPPDVPDR